MADEKEPMASEEMGENTMLREAMEALRNNDRVRARDLLTRLLKANQNNANYWVWLSAAVDTRKEMIYCLQSALKLEPGNTAAKRGLVLFGALPPNDSIPPFPVNHPRLWEEQLAQQAKSKLGKQGWANPMTRVFMALGIGIIVIGFFIGGYFLLPKSATAGIFWNPTRRPGIFLTYTPSATPLIQTPTSTFPGPTPLARFIQKTYTPTPLYVVTEHPVLTRASFEAGLRSMAYGNFSTARVQFQEVLKSEPDSPDVFYYIGESYRAEGNYQAAQENYQKAINKNPRFAPAYLGRARAKLAQNPDANVIDDLNAAISLDPNYAEAYIERGTFLISRDPAAAKSDLEIALEINPDSPVAYLHLSEAEFSLGDYDAALESGLRANRLDMTLIPVYLVLGKAYLATGQNERAVGVLQTYTLFSLQDIGANEYLGTAYNGMGEFQLAVDVLSRALEADPRNSNAYYQRGFAYLSMDKANLAVADFNQSVVYDPHDFDAQLGLALAFDKQGLPGNAYEQASSKAFPLAETNSEKAKVYYWEAIFLENSGTTNALQNANFCWRFLLALPPDAMPAEWRAQAFQHLNITPTPTVRPSPTRTLKITPTP